MKKYLYVFFIAIPMLFTACSSKIYFTKETREFAEKNNIPLTKLQFYVDRKVELRRELSSSDVNASGGKIVLEGGKQIYIITLGKRTGGLCVKIKDSRTLEITFEGGDNKTLIFSIPRIINLDGTLGDYALDYELAFPNKDKNEIKYDGLTYLVNEQPKLKVKKKSFSKLKVKKKRMKGVKVN